MHITRTLLSSAFIALFLFMTPALSFAEEAAPAACSCQCMKGGECTCDGCGCSGNCGAKEDPACTCDCCKKDASACNCCHGKADEHKK